MASDCIQDIMGPTYFREAAEVIDDDAGGPRDRAKMMDVFRRHGMTLAALEFRS